MSATTAAPATLAALRPVQLAYHVPDPVEAATRLARDHGWGPFYLMEHIALETVRYRGSPGRFDHTSAYGQAGEMMVELIMQHDDSPSAFRDAFPPGAEGLHHVAIMPEDYRATVDRFVAMGYPVATELRTRSGRGASFVDTRPMMGHMVEIYPVSDGVLGLYRRVADEAARWDGRTLKIELDGAS